jgi:hypothetical protein
MALSNATASYVALFISSLALFVVFTEETIHVALLTLVSHWDYSTIRW